MSLKATGIQIQIDGLDLNGEADYYIDIPPTFRKFNNGVVIDICISTIWDNTQKIVDSTGVINKVDHIENIELVLTFDSRQAKIDGLYYQLVHNAVIATLEERQPDWAGKLTMIVDGYDTV